VWFFFHLDGNLILDNRVAVAAVRLWGRAVGTT
jgi:hypothetical protein